MAVEIDLAQEGDTDWSAGIMASSDPWVTLGRKYEQCFARVSHPEYRLLIARVNGVRAGLVLLHPRGFASSPYVAILAVAPEFRSRGIGSALLARAEIEFPEARFLFLLVSSFNSRAQTLYERHGYKRVGEIPEYVIPGCSELMFAKRLVKLAQSL